MFQQIADPAGRATRPMRVGRDWRRPDAAGDWVIHWRDADGFGQLLPRPTPDETAAFLDDDTHGTTGAPAERPYGIWRRALVHLAWRVDRSVDCDARWWSALLPTPGASCLEIGCGGGDTLVILRGHGHEVVGLEPDPAARARAASQGVPAMPGTAEDLPAALAGRLFDVVILLHVLKHCLDPMLALRNAAALLASGGRLVVEVPDNACHGAQVFGPAWHWLDVPRHLNFFTPPSLRAILSAAGLSVQAVEYTGYCRQFGADWDAAQRRIAAVTGQSQGRQGWRTPWLLARSASAASERSTTRSEWWRPPRAARPDMRGVVAFPFAVGATPLAARALAVSRAGGARGADAAMSRSRRRDRRLAPSRSVNFLSLSGSPCRALSGKPPR